MLTSRDSAEPALRWPATTAQSRQIGVVDWSAGLVPAFWMLATWVWVMYAGQDLCSDVMNHHLYLPFSLLSGRFATDLFAAGPQSYQNPIGYLPFYWMVQAGWPAWLIGSALALLHGLFVLPVWALTRQLWRDDPSPGWWPWIAMALAWASPVFLLFAGTSSIDPLTQVLVLMGLAAAVYPPSPRTAHAVASGALFGLAIALKPTNAIFALAAACAVVMRCMAGQTRWRDLLAGALGLVVVAGLGMGFWSYELWARFGNPFFPLFNQYFQSPYAPSQPFFALRFMPESLGDWIARPWVMAEFRAWTSTEAFAPDLRLLALVALVGCSIPIARLRGVRTQLGSPTLQLGVFVLSSYLLWMSSSGNSRYAMPMLAVAGLLVARAGYWLLGASAGRVLLGVLLVLQLGIYWKDGDHRLRARPWGSWPYLQTAMPEQLQKNPYLHISIGVQSLSGLAPSMHPDGAFINAVGQLSLPMEGPLGEALKQRLRAWEGRTRFLFGYKWTGAAPSPDMQRRADGTVYHLGLRIDWTDCLPIVVRTDDGTPPSALHEPPSTILSCRAVPTSGRDVDFEVQRARMDRVFARIEQRCPKFFGPAPFVTDIGGDFWQRHYVNTDVRVTIDGTETVVANYFRNLKGEYLGKVDEILSGGGADPCEAWKRLKTS